MAGESNAEEWLKRAVGLPELRLLNCGNAGIFSALFLAREAGKGRVLAPKDGGWFSYKTYPKLLGMELVELETDWGLIQPEVLRRVACQGDVLLYARIAGYFAEQPAPEITSIMHKAGGLVIEDVSGSIGILQYSGADFVVGSFGNGKPLEVGYGGFIASSRALDNPLFTMFRYHPSLLQGLEKAITLLPQRLEFYYGLRARVLSEICCLAELAHPSLMGINLMVKGHPQAVMDYCKAKKFPYVLCPAYHRVRKKGISIELKRLSPETFK